MGSYTEVTRQSWISRMGGAFKGILAGLLLFIGSFILLGWNEYRSVKEYRGLNQMESVAVALESPSYNEVNDGVPVHFSGMATTTETLNDPTFLVSAQALKLRRVVEMYQWKENKTPRTETKVGGAEETVTEYTYERVWSEGQISSSSFYSNIHPDTGEQMVNPSMMYSSETYTAENVTVGDFTLSASLKARISGSEALPVNQIPPSANFPANAIIRDGGYYIPASLMGATGGPQIGDYRIRFEVVRPATVTVVAVQNSNRSLTPYMEDFELLSMGEFTLAQMFEQAQAARATLTWILRLVGFAMMFIGLNMILRPLSMLTEVIPLLGRITGGILSFICFILALVLSLITIGIMWIAVRPLLGGAILAVAAGIFLLIFFIRKKKDDAPAAAAAPPSAPPPAPGS